MKRGRKPVQIDEAKVKALASRGLTIEQIALSLGITSRTLYNHRLENESLQDAYREGKSKGIAEIANALYEKAKKGDTTAMIFYLKTQAGWSDTQKLEVKAEVKTDINLKEMSDAELIKIANGELKNSGT